MEFANGFRDLKVYKLSRQLSRDVFEASKAFPKQEMYSLTDQIRRSSRSVGAQIAEAWGKRRYSKYFVSKLTDAVGELHETEHWIETAEDSQYISKDLSKTLTTQYAMLGKMLHAMINKSATFSLYSE